MHQLQLRIGGRVQGVGFRRFVLHRAADHGVRGTVRNLTDGTVELFAEGESVAMHAFAADVRNGPPYARVEPIEEHWSEGPARFTGFSIIG